MKTPRRVFSLLLGMHADEICRRAKARPSDRYYDTIQIPRTKFLCQRSNRVSRAEWLVNFTRGLVKEASSASPSIGPWGIPLAAPSCLPSTNAVFGDLVGHPRRRTSCDKARSCDGGPSEDFLFLQPQIHFRETAEGPHSPGHTVECT